MWAYALQLCPPRLPLDRREFPGLRPISLLRALQPAPEFSCHDRVGLVVPSWVVATSP